MVKIVLITKNKSVITANVNKFSTETLHKKCKFRSADDFKKRATMKKALGNIQLPNANELMLKVLLDEEK